MCYGPLYEVVVVVVTEHRTGLKDCLDHLVAAVEYAAAQGIRAFIIVHDNGSGGAVTDLVDGFDDRVYWSRSTRTLGYAQARNRNLRYARREGIPFTVYVDPRAQVRLELIAELVTFMRRCDNVGAAEPHRPAATSWDAPEDDLHHGPQEPSAFELTPTQNWSPRRDANDPGPEVVDRVALPGTVYIVRTAMIESIGVFDETHRTPLAIEDLCVRARYDGWRIVVLPRLDHDLPAPARDLLAEPLRDIFYFFACDPGVTWSMVARGASTLVLMDLALSFRRSPWSTIVTYAGLVHALAVLAWRWPRVREQRRSSRRLADNPTWTPGDSHTTEPTANASVSRPGGDAPATAARSATASQEEAPR